MRKIIILAAAVILFGSCQEQESKEEKKDTGKSKYIIEQYSGGVMIKRYSFYGEAFRHSDGTVSIDNGTDTLIVITGDLVIKQFQSK